MKFIIKKSIEAKNISDALAKERRAVIDEVYKDTSAPERSTDAIGFHVI